MSRGFLSTDATEKALLKPPPHPHFTEYSAFTAEVSLREKLAIVPEAEDRWAP